MARKPNTANSASERELQKVEEQFNEFDEQVKSLTLDRMNMAPKEEVEPQTKLATSEIDKKRDVYLKPKRTIASAEKFNEKFREDYNFQKEYVHFTAENREIIGESLDLWTKPFPGMPAEEWIVPVNTPVWGPRYLAEQIKSCSYHRLIMKDVSTSEDGAGRYYGAMAADTTINRLDAVPVSTRRSVFMGATSFK